MNFTKCICPMSGFCKIFNMDMNKKDWDWCQTSSDDERRSFYDYRSGKIKVSKKQDLRFVTNLDLYKAADKLIPLLEGFDAIAGIPRSGMMPASYLATLLSKPLFSVIKDKLEMLKFMSDFGGSRMGGYKGGIKNIAFVDDTTCNGRTARRVKDTFGSDIKVFSVFTTADGATHVDGFGEILEPPHILEWNFFNSTYCTDTMFDIDGVFCDNVPIDICRDEERYIFWIANVMPRFARIPKLFKAHKLVTGRLEKYRPITEHWLKKHSFNYDELVMFPNEREEERNKNHYEVVGKYKAEIFNSSDCKFFVESEMSESKFIRDNTKSPHKIVICPDSGAVL